MRASVDVYVCPNDNCGNYYGSSSMGELSTVHNFAPAHAKDAGQSRGTRSICPICKADRVRVTAIIVDPKQIEQAKTA